MSDNVTLAWWLDRTRGLWIRWVEGFFPRPESWPPPPDDDDLPSTAGVPLPGPVSSGWALDYYRRPGRLFGRTPAGTEMRRFKYRGDLDSGWRLVRAAARFFFNRAMVENIDRVVPAPSSPEFRAFSPSAWLGEKLAEIIGKPVLTDLFTRTRLGVPQKELHTLQAKRANIAGMFKVASHKKRKIAGKHILLIDDLTKSGHTLAELRRVLHNAGSGKIILFAFTNCDEDHGRTGNNL